MVLAEALSIWDYQERQARLHTNDGDEEEDEEGKTSHTKTTNPYRGLMGQISFSLEEYKEG